MARTAIDLITTADEAWGKLQLLPTWEGVAGISDLREPQHDVSGNLTAFRFGLDTALGWVDGQALATAQMPGMMIRGEAKGLEITLNVVLRVAAERTTAMVDAAARSTSFLSKPLAITLNALLDGAIDDEAAKIARRINQL